ncbi:CCA tRNA nucleotidyltransferase, mitochondrial [Gnomoniopsis smithogilvyi]|uniref:CCA tRNA nucleotidyltransferase, mitochondrial n=1 Tax=Gnomoniopsis smithogilvyi TaxID=1191159 RepID=A0A9W9CY70_9PEZI|nr:CCA tRNA nucleotidyltransferase, mitochondrial [Gnomoniopsis smithogilvyi]
MQPENDRNGLGRTGDQAAPRFARLQPAEVLLRELLLDCRDDILSCQQPIVPHLEMYIVGGWVRDHLLGIPSSDVDVALSSMTGVEFSRTLNVFADKHHGKYQQRAKENGIEYVKPAHFTVVDQNPAMSKKLDTAVGKAFGLEVDLVNLRKEVYDDEDSRKPTMTFGTAAEDAFRRDATVNALFVDLETLEVHDFTGQGLADLEKRIMRTPLEPRQTFLDDPLRVLRLIRIGCKLDFSIAEEALSSMKQEEIHRALDRKVKRERLSIELVRMMELPHPESSLHVIFESNLFATVFLSDTSSLALAMKRVLPEVHGQPWPPTWPRAYKMLANILENDEDMLKGLVVAEQEATHSWDEAKARLWLMAVYAPIAHCQQHGVPLKTAREEIKHAINLTSRTADLLALCLSNLRSIDETVSRTALSERPTRSSIGMAIREWGKSWRQQVLFSLVASLVFDPAHSDQGQHMISRRYEDFVAFVDAEDLWDADSTKPLLDGREAMKILGVGKGGKFIKAVIDEIVAFQFDNPGCHVEQVKYWAIRQRDRWISNGGLSTSAD